MSKFILVCILIFSFSLHANIESIDGNSKIETIRNDSSMQITLIHEGKKIASNTLTNQEFEQFMNELNALEKEALKSPQQKMQTTIGYGLLGTSVLIAFAKSNSLFAKLFVAAITGFFSLSLILIPNKTFETTKFLATKGIKNNLTVQASQEEINEVFFLIEEFKHAQK